MAKPIKPSTHTTEIVPVPGHALWLVRCSCGWKSIPLASEDAVRRVAEMHAGAYT